VLADDHPDIPDEVRHFLAFEFDVLSTVGDGKALIQAVSEWSPDAAISDIQMPDWEASRQADTFFAKVCAMPS